MAIGTSSGVYIGELDLSQVIGNASTSVAAIVFASSRGRVNERVFITSTKQFIEEFGTPDPKVSYAHYAALAFLQEGNQLWCVRAAGANAQYAGVVLQKLTAAPYATLFNYAMTQPSAFDPVTSVNGSTSETENLSYIHAIGPGSYAKDVQVEFVSHNLKPVTGLTISSLFTAKFSLNVNKNLSGPSDVQGVAIANVAALTGATTVGGYAPVPGDLVLLTAQTTATQNGLYLVSAGAWVKQADPDYVRFITGPVLYRKTAPNTYVASPETVGGVVAANNDLAVFYGQTVSTQNGLYKWAATTGLWVKQTDQPQVLVGGIRMFTLVNGAYVLDNSFTTANLGVGTYNYLVTAANATGETLGTVGTSTVSGANTANVLVWDSVVGASTYSVYGRTSGSIFLLATVTKPTFMDTGMLTPDATRVPPAAYLGSQDFTFNVYDNMINPTVPVESFTCTLKSNLNGFGQQTEFSAQLNDASNGSRYVRVVNPAFDDLETPLVYSTGKVSLTGGASGSAVSDSTIVNAWGLFSSKENCSINILINGGYASPTVQLAMDALASRRQDCIAILDLPSSYNLAATAVDYRNNKLNLNSNYSAIYGPDLLIADTYNGTQLYVPPSGHIAGVYAKTDRDNDPWFAPAGLTRGMLRVLGLRQVYSDGERELLQQSQINYVRKFPGIGYAVMEAYTMQGKMSALSFVPVRRMLMVIETAVAKAMMYSLWEPNDPIIRLQIVNMIGDYLEVIKQRRGIKRYLVVCNDDNNAPQTTANGTLNVDVYIDPVLPVARISLRMIVTKQGMSFSEAILMGAQR
jgi:phage tail sheath protein FI